MTTTSGAGRRARGEIEKLPSGSLRVRVYAGSDPISRKKRYLTETVPAGPHAAEEAERTRARLLSTVEQRRALRERSAGRALDRDLPADGGDAGRWAELPVVKPAGKPRGRRRGDLTVATIAQLAGVSAPTVSKVLNGRSGVAADTRRRVEALLRERGYHRPEIDAPAATVEVVFYGMQSDLAIEIMQGVEQVAGEYKLTVGFTDVARQTSAGRFWAHDLLARRPTGVIAAQLGITSEQHALLVASAVPVVAVDPVGEPVHPIPSVGAANWAGAIAAVRHVLDLGHRRIAVISGPTERLCAKVRHDATRAALDAAGVGLDERLVRRGWFAFEDGLSHGGELLGLPDPPSAILCGNDLQALGVYEAARQAGVRIPHELSVVGFDDLSLTRWCGPPLTTVRQPITEMGATAARLVLALAAGETLNQSHVELATTLVVRDSTAPPAR